MSFGGRESEREHGLLNEYVVRTEVVRMIKFILHISLSFLPLGTSRSCVWLEIHGYSKN